MVFGLFRKDAKSEPFKAESLVAVPITSLVPVVPDESRLAQLGPVLWHDVRYGMTLGEVAGVRTELREHAA